MLQYFLFFPAEQTNGLNDVGKLFLAFSLSIKVPLKLKRVLFIIIIF
jgi:hypothetical protein